VGRLEHSFEWSSAGSLIGPLLISTTQQNSDESRTNARFDISSARLNCEQTADRGRGFELDSIFETAHPRDAQVNKNLVIHLHYGL
jgi:hypothetical protein